MQWISVALLLPTIVLNPTFAGAKPDIAHGEALHSAHCTRCHAAMTGGDGAVLYTREQRLVNSMQELMAQVRYYQSRLKLHWSHADIDDVAHYLNQRYYQFDKTSE
jgi:cytochrome c553